MGGLIIPKLVFAGVMLDKVKTIATNGGYDANNTNEYSLTSYAGTIVNVVLGLLGIIFVILTIYAGFTWMTSGGEEEKIKKSTKILSAALIGLVVVVASYALWNFIYFKILK